MPTIRLGISTCPNDTFAFDGLLNHRVDWRGLDFQVELLDIQQLNDRLFGGDFDVAKTSFHAALHLAGRTIVLPSGSALGFGVGPLLLSAHPDCLPDSPSQVTLCPGQHTTAAMLFTLFYPQTTQVKHRVFSEIMPALKRREADFGVCIHEGRFTWQDEGLGLVEDLGTRWEQTTGCPLPLGGLVADRQLPHDTALTVQQVVRDSLDHALAHREQALPTMRKYAQEFDDDVLMKHVDLYVNDWTLDLGTTGREALQKLSQMARSLGLISPSTPALEVLSP
ncbi:MAG: 1,4-dihydroxy-6-naphthoate synthase [Pirellulales bacterium]|nr:1,4-dihydroxy-6-naphthoate synthase [Pirellulales bacterium]